MSPRRIYAVILRQLFLYRRSFTRVLDVFYWPTVDLLLWGFITVYLAKAGTTLPPYASFFLGGLILWNILLRAQQGVSVSFLEDIWARNLINLFVSPLKISEYLAALLCISLIKVCLAFAVLSLLASLCFGFGVFKMGFWLLLFILNLCAMGWAIGWVTMSAILWFGQEAEILAWALAFLFLPVSGVFYPVEVLPDTLRLIALFVPASYVFEGMREVLLKQTLHISLLYKAFGLNMVYLTGSLFLFLKVYRKALIKGTIPKIGE
ncbi:ABC-2 type transporter [Thermodesulfatator indicus DSM 15286]|uniref:Transport permease protein n=1 Tax=Thermodesulfatator indicus (strain DSM 15286 / JCM 11887 / CIR29812) TaxID=667014 RepID=F8A9L2_THEID|nr:ABC transporter permease [Thermodesulfatator indicus]AEH45238.1 ABC-2 type transporter [Thermodesulfatator indicus DSM 15286]